MPPTTNWVWMFALLAVALAIVVLNDRSKERVVRRAEREGRKPPRRYLNYKTSWMSVLGFLIGVPLLMIFTRLRNAAILVLRMSLAVALLMMALAIAVILLIGAILVCVLVYTAVSPKYRALKRAAGLQQAGDVQGAIALLHGFLRTHRPSAAIYDGVAVLYGVLGDWERALLAIEDARKLSKNARFLAQKGAILRKLRRLDQALPCLRDALNRRPGDLTIVCDYGQVLVGMGKRDEARDLLGRAELLLAKQTPRGREAHPALKALVEDLRNACDSASSVQTTDHS
jgi:tetratricopeptide (TPR) repeat protein